MKISKHFSVIILGSALWSSFAIESLAQGFNLRLPAIMNFTSVKLTKYPPRLAQKLEDAPDNSQIDKDLGFREIGITRDSSDGSLLTITGSIDNHSDRSHYVYYIVTKFVSNDTSIKQAIIPINSLIAPGESAKFNHEISTQSINSVAPETVKPVVVKYEYR